MERIHQVIGAGGLQIPLFIVQRYGLQPGAEVVLELGADEIRILPAIPGQAEIENRALRYLLSHLGDAATIKVERDGDVWRVSVYGIEGDEPLGELVYSLAGELLADRSTPLEEMRQRVGRAASVP